MTDIVERLKAREIMLQPGDRLSLKNITPWLKQTAKMRGEAADEITRLRAENERLREALKRIAEDRTLELDRNKDNACIHRKSVDQKCARCHERCARAALNTEGEG